MISLRWLMVWRRNLQVWQRLAGPSLLANFAEPLMILLALGYGLGAFIGTVQGIPYMVFLLSGIICGSAMNAASFEGLYSAYTRMSVQQTWYGMLATPLDVADIVIGEMVWAATKSLLSVTTILIVAALFGIVPSWQAIWILPVMLLVGICFGAMALIMTTFAHNYDFFLYYITLFITPLALLSGVYFPLESLHSVIQQVVWWFPLAHAVTLTRALMIGESVTIGAVVTPLSVLVIYTVIATYMAIKLAKRRLSA